MLYFQLKDNKKPYKTDFQKPLQKTDLKVKSNLLNSYVNDRIKTIKRQLYSFQKKREPSCLHQIRVEIKRIRAVFSFAEKMYGQYYDANALRQLYQEAGIIRELQLIICLISEYPDYPKLFISGLQENENELTEEFAGNIPAYIESINSFSENVSLPAALPKKKVIRQYLKKQGQKAILELDNKGKENMHRFRKRLKKFMSVYDLLPHELQKSIKINKSDLDKMQEKVGIWHDTYSAIRFLSKQSFYGKDNFISRLGAKEERQFRNLFRRSLDIKKFGDRYGTKRSVRKG
ncbi:MAG: CHAD domain-containing protein [Paludibacteraceae bacterium]